jgi:muramoyltetrapeptide carboxypeptidase
VNWKIKPNRLTNGMTIGVISPASRPLDETIYYRGIEYLKQLGYDVIASTHVLDKRGYLAGHDEDRAEDLNAMFRNPEIGAIICSRGGYGTPRLIDKIDFDAIQNNPKIFVGYSDLTAVSLAIWQQTGLVTFSGPMVAVEMGRGIDPFTETSFWTTVTSPDPVGLLANPDSSPVRVIKPGKAEGRLLGGCLSLINVLAGTPYFPDFDGAILIIEDIDEEPYRVDRYLAQLKLAGVFEKIAGIVLGQFIDCDPKDPEKPSLELDQIFLDYFENLNIPIIANFAYGHGAIKHTIPIGIHAILDTEQGGLILAENAVREIIS